ncbi:MAG: NAD(P)H-dependent oxidoreductase [Acutalibacteraceae bacterium]|nr:NAD(P)H-dependent oxidoreductase [Acutalibacteraceae bacterium]
MKIVIINGQNHKGSTYNIAKMLADKVGGDLTEFFLPRDFGEFCVGCNACFSIAEEKCPHYEKLKPLTQAMLDADLIILASPVYCYHATGAMKVFLDHYGYQWMVHRPNEKMFSKQAVCVATAAGAGMKSTMKDMADSLFFWGVPKAYRLGFAVRAVSYNTVNEKIKAKIDKKTTALAKKINKRKDRVRVGIKTKGFFFIMRMLHKDGWNKVDVDYWNEKGWSDKKRPWKK